MNNAPADEDPNTIPLPVLSQFFTWAPGDEPAPYDPPRTSATEPPRPNDPSSHHVVDVVPRPPAANQTSHRRRWLVAGSAVAVVATASIVFWPEPNSTDQPSPPRLTHYPLGSIPGLQR